MLEDYKKMNMQVSAAFGVEYVDVRTAFLNEIPSYWFFIPYGIVTVDGEHENSHGTDILVDLFTQALDRYLKSNSTTVKEIKYAEESAFRKLKI